MFEGTGPAREKLNDGLDKINEKYGKNTIYMGTSWNAKHSAPMRIAFHHIPDLETDDDDEWLTYSLFFTSNHTAWSINRSIALLG